MRAHGAVDEQLQQIRTQHVPVVVVVLLAVFAAHDESTDTAVAEECLVDSEVRQVFFYGQPFLGIERLAGLDCIEGGRRVGGVSGERIRG